jgi:hypothetical protein
MSFLLSNSEFDAARSAVARGAITADLYAFLHRLVASHARQRLLARALTPRGRIDEEAVQELVHDWLSDRLLSGGLLSAFDAVASPKALSRYLEESLRNYLASKARARGGPRLLIRARQLLESAPTQYVAFRTGSSWRETWWGLTQWPKEPEPFQGSDDELARVAYALGDFAIVRYSAGSEREDPVLSTPDLDRFLTGLLRGVAKLLTLGHVDLALKRRFSFAYHPAAVDLEEAAEPASSELQPGEELLVRETAREILSEVTERQLAILRDKLREGLTLDALAERHGVSRGTADNELRRVDAVARTHTLDDNRFDEILEAVVDFASYEDGEP